MPYERVFVDLEKKEHKAGNFLKVCLTSVQCHSVDSAFWVRAGAWLLCADHSANMQGLPILDKLLNLESGHGMPLMYVCDLADTPAGQAPSHAGRRAYAGAPVTSRHNC